MPIYEFYCSACDHRFESLMKPYDPAECPKCKTRTVNKVPSVTGGYTEIKGNDASARPKGAGSRPR